MARRQDLQNKLEELLGSRNVYFNAPESKKMEYQAIKYSLKNIDTKYANDAIYSMMNCYELIVIGRTPNDEVVGTLLLLPFCSYDRQYTADNLIHDVLTLYY